MLVYTVKVQLPENFFYYDSSWKLVYITEHCQGDYMSSTSFNIASDATGVLVREHLIKLQAHLPNFNTVYSVLLFEQDEARAILDEVESLANDITVTKNTLRKGAASKKVGLMSVKVAASDGIEYTIPQAKKKLNEAKHSALVARLRLDELKVAIQTYRSILTWDRVEYEHSS